LSARQTAVIGRSMRIKGEIHSEEDLVIDGEVEGTLELRGRLTLGSTGKVTANVRATEVVIAGALRGNVDASEKVILRAGAHIVGDVKTASIVIEDGAFFKGGIDIALPEKAKAAGSAMTTEAPRAQTPVAV
jgi:cytoskeletal protein CcmA (bactofilin family)